MFLYASYFGIILGWVTSHLPKSLPLLAYSGPQTTAYTQYTQQITNGSTDSHHNVSSKTVSTNKLDVEQQQLTKDEVVVVVNNSGQSPNPIEKVKIKPLEKTYVINSKYLWAILGLKMIAVPYQIPSQFLGHFLFKKRKRWKANSNRVAQYELQSTRSCP